MKETPIDEITLRRYENPENLDERELVRKLCLSIGLLQPGDSRDIIVDVLLVILQNKKKNKMLGSEEVRELVMNLRKNMNLSMNGIASSNIRRQLKRLKDIYMIEKIRTGYRMTENDCLRKTFENKIQNYLLNNVVERVKEYCDQVDLVFCQ